jgi:hypothetical protein
MGGKYHNKYSCNRLEGWGMACIDMAEERDKLGALMNVVMNLRVP